MGPEDLEEEAGLSHSKFEQARGRAASKGSTTPVLAILQLYTDSLRDEHAIRDGSAANLGVRNCIVSIQ